MTAGHARRRNRTWSVTIVVIACCASASCSSSVSLDMTLRNREEMRAQVACAGGSFNGTKRTCRLRFQDQVWSNGAGRGVVVPAYTVTFEVVDHDYGTGECGGRAVTGDSASSTAPGVISDRGSFHSDGDDASAVELAPQQGLWVGGFADKRAAEVTGSWRGIAGDLEHRAGTFTMITNSLQTELHLVEE